MAADPIPPTGEVSMPKIAGAIVRDNSLSMSAHNLKRVAADGVVTLRGPVDSAVEKTASRLSCRVSPASPASTTRSM